MCVETHGVPPLRSREARGPGDRIPPGELTRLGPDSFGWVAKPDAIDVAAPIVIVCHERYGVVRHTVELTEKFAGAGFVAVAPDFYADMDLSGEHERLPDIGDASALRHLDAAASYVRAMDARLTGTSIAVIGIC